jgi:hypothetical protein
VGLPLQASDARLNPHSLISPLLVANDHKKGRSMKVRIVLGVLLAAFPLASGSAMPVSTFLEKADRLEKKGPLALFSGDLKLLTNQVKADFASLRTDRLAAKAAGKPTAWCPPEKVAMSDKDVMAAMRAVAPAERAQTATRGALRAMLIRKFPCKAQAAALIT